MKHPVPTLAAVAGGALLLASCATPGTPSMQPRVDVESIERQAPVTPTPNVGQHEAARNAVRYSNDQGYGHRGYGYNRWHPGF